MLARSYTEDDGNAYMLGWISIRRGWTWGLEGPTGMGYRSPSTTKYVVGQMAVGDFFYFLYDIFGFARKILATMLEYDTIRYMDNDSRGVFNYRHDCIIQDIGMYQYA